MNCCFPESQALMRVQVLRHTDLDRPASLAGPWDRLARGVPFRGWAWLSTWWRHYGNGDQNGHQPKLYVLEVLDDAGRLVGLAPCYVERSPSRGRVLRFLGSGEVCSDYLTVLCEPGFEDHVVSCLADWLIEASVKRDQGTAGGLYDAWDLIEWKGVQADDWMTVRLAGELAARGAMVHQRPGMSCWRIVLPDCLDGFLTRLSQDHRKKLRQTMRKFVDTGRAVLHTVQDIDQLARGQEILIDLHQRRRRCLGGIGRFASARFEGFHRDIMRQLWEAGQLRLHWVELDHRPVAAEYHVEAGGVVYAYQSGIDPNALHDSPGRLIHLMTIRRAIEQGLYAFDFLRGDEPYKAHWRAEPRPTVDIRIAAPHPSARLRHRVWLAASRLNRWLRNPKG